jgi:uncharacterized protein (DUF1778 family)
MARKRTTPEPATLDERVEIRMSGDEKDAFQMAAKRQGITLSQWLRLAAQLVIQEHGGRVKLLDMSE